MDWWCWEPATTGKFSLFSMIPMSNRFFFKTPVSPASSKGWKCSSTAISTTKETCPPSQASFFHFLPIIGKAKGLPTFKMSHKGLRIGSCLLLLCCLSSDVLLSSSKITHPKKSVETVLVVRLNLATNPASASTSLL